MSNITQFPIPALTISQITPFSSATFADSIVADQAGVTGTETLQKIFNLFLPNMFLAFNGNPNGNVAGLQYQTCYDLIDQTLYICTFPGPPIVAVWRKCISSSSILWNVITSGSATMVSDQGYVADGIITTTLTLPSSSVVGDLIYVVGRQSGWTIAQLANQQIFVSPSQTTVGVGGSLSSAHVRDSVTLICTKDNLEWQVIAQQSAALNII